MSREGVKGGIIFRVSIFVSFFLSVFLLTKLLFAYSIFMSYLLQFYVPMDFLEPIVFKVLRLEKLFARFPRNRQVLVTIAQIGLRTILVLLTGKTGIYLTQGKYCKMKSMCASRKASIFQCFWKSYL